VRGTGLLVAWLAFGLMPGGLLRADLKAALAEHDLGKRSKLALDNAAAALKTAREAYEKGESEKLAAAAGEIEESVDLASVSLKSTGKNPRNSPKWFKQAEIAIRGLLKKMETFERDMNFTDRSVLDKAKVRTQQVHDELLLGLMEGKHK
jgi:hypothetical protein